MKCPACSGSESSVIRTEQADAGVRRTRQCASCGKRWRTIEAPAVHFEAAAEDEARRRWGLTEFNPCAGVQLHPEPPRDTLPDDSDIFGKVYRKLDPPMRFAVAMIRFYGRRKAEILGASLASAQDDGLHLRRAKGSRVLIVKWDRRLRRMWARLMAWRSSVQREGVPSTMAVLNRRGLPVTVTGFNSAWRRAMKRAGLKGAFTFHDLRASRASSLPPELAAEVLAHDDPATTRRHYRRGPLVIDLNGGG